MNGLNVKRLCAWCVTAMLFAGWAGMAAAAQWANPGLLVDAKTVKENAGKANWVVVDCRDLKDYAKGHIPGAISLGNRCKKALRDSTSRLYRDAGRYEKLLGKIGIGNDTHVVFYYGDLKTLTDATVGFWLMEYLGHDKAHVLNGGLDAWRKAGYRLDNKPVRKEATTFKAKVAASSYGETAEVLDVASGESKAQLVDSRTAKEHKGSDIRAIRGGHVPNTTVNASHLDTLAKAKNPKTGKLETTAYLDADAASKAFAGLDKGKRTVAYCQTGTRSTLTYLQLRLLGFKDPANWDESWRVYGSQLAYPVAGEQWYNFASMNKKIKSLEKQVSALEAAKKK
ncbi:MAG: sulfurtransferase [Pseudomonadota bacterium]|nr:MAG: sulfurtransferase [Pseudomonadota bacterium]